jgi:hypothetical protein
MHALYVYLYHSVFEQTLSYVTKVVPPADPDMLRAASRELRV